MAKIEAFLVGRHCLVLDDEFLIGLDIQEVLEAAGAASVVCVGDVDEAMKALRETKFDLAVLDVNLGGGGRTSLSVAAALAEQNTPFVFLTGMTRDPALAAAYPGAPVVEKPYQTPLLLAAIRRAMQPG